MTDTLVFVIYIKATPERVWEAVTSPEFRARYFFGQTSTPDTAVGARLRSWGPDGTPWGDNEILASEPPRLFVHSWRALYDPELAAEPASRVTWLIEPMDDSPFRPGDYCRLTVTHDQLGGSPRTAAAVTGWSWIISGLKTLVETGEPLVAQ